jgi:hypothetical protein
VPKGPRLLGPPAVDGNVSFSVLTPKNIEGMNPPKVYSAVK